MYLRTPKRYSSGRGRRRRGGIRFRWLLLYLLTPIVVLVGIYVYQNQDELQPQVQEAVDDMIGDAVSSVSTQRAPEPTPTPDPSDTLNIARNAWTRGSITEATRRFGEVIELVPNDVGTHYFYTLGLIMQDFNAESIEAAESAVTANPFSADAWTIQAFAYNFAGRYEDAIPSALQALELASESMIEQDPNVASIRARALAQLGYTYYELGQSERALSTVEEALELDENTPNALYVRGLVNWLVIFDRDSARADFQRAYELSPTSHYIGTALMSLQYETQDFEAMEQLGDAILELNPDYPRALQWLGTYYRAVVGDPNQASEYFTRCVQANPNYDDCHYQLGRVQIASEDYTGALSSFETAIDVNDQDGYYYYWAAETYILSQPSEGCTQAMTYLQSGYRLALESEDQGLIDSFEFSLQNCGSPVRPPDAEVTPEVETES